MESSQQYWTTLGDGQYLRFIVLIQEDYKVSPNTDVNKALSPQLTFKTLSVSPARARTLDLPHDTVVPNQLS